MSAPKPLPPKPEIISALRTEGDEALARYFETVKPRLKQIVKFRLDPRLGGRVATSDVIQETYVRAAKRIDSFLDKDDMPFFVWLRLEVGQKIHEIHRYHFGAEKRDARKEARLVQNEGSDKTSMMLAAHLVAQMTSPSQVVERDEQFLYLRAALDEMDELDREVIALRHFEELSNVETANVLNIQTAAASKRYIRALQRLKQIMESAKKFNDR